MALALAEAPSWRGEGVDISPTSVNWARALAEAAGTSDRANIHEGDALSFRPQCPAQAAISCFVLEHLEKPEALLGNMAEALEPGAPAFVTAAITAAEIDHIYEFRRESELVALAEQAGFRVCASYSAAPERRLPGRRFLPRSMGLVLERRHGEFW